MSNVADKVKDVALDEVHRIEKLTNDAARSGAYLYPLRGIYYFITHKDLWKPLTTKLAPSLSLGLVVTTTLFLTAYLPQAALMAFTSGPIAAVSAFFLTLSESSTLTTVLAKIFLVQDALTDTFDGTLLSTGRTTNLVEQGRQVKGGGGDPISKLGKLVKRPFEKYSPGALVRYLMYLPLNAVPVVGTVVFVVAQGRKAGPGAHESFGVAAVLLEMVPVASIFFAFTNTVGAALWAADMEKGQVDQEGTSPKLREQVKKAE